MSLEHINFRDRIPVGISEEMVYQSIIRYIYFQHFRQELIILKELFEIHGSIAVLTSAEAAGLFLGQYWNG